MNTQIMSFIYLFNLFVGNKQRNLNNRLYVYRGKSKIFLAYVLEFFNLLFLLFDHFVIGIQKGYLSNIQNIKKRL